MAHDHTIENGDGDGNENGNGDGSGSAQGSGNGNVQGGGNRNGGGYGMIRHRTGPVPALLPLGLRAVLGVLGGGSFGTGIAAVFVTENGTGTGVLLAIGAVLLVVALLGHRIESFEVGGASLRLRAAAADRYQLADASELAGDQDTADALREEARVLLRAAGPLAAEYGTIRSTMRSGSRRTRAMEDLVTTARRLAERGSFTPDEVRGLLRGGTDGDRVVALAMMQARPGLRDLDAALDAVAAPRSPFEQYQALALAAKMVDDLDTDDLRRLADTVRAERAGSLRRNAERSALADDVLRRADRRIEAAGRQDQDPA
ncbi:hypothetical protein [Streptomyces odontomachi]|uniref:hypothetical protein n=1 Tax=Streptomyces odontomachi TaxID=2944940 RepID=UPI002108834A|nr:hypothetical protein [Streptomyces sp. ODS25]